MATVREIDKNDDVYVGVELPLNHNVSGFFKRSKTVREQVKSNIRNLLLTAKGERVMQPTFGCDITSQLFEQIDSETLENMDIDIRQALGTWLPYVVINDLFVMRNQTNENEINISLEYSTTLEPGMFDNISFTLVSGE
tara:strand:+ start:104 stop:520 length:417 start_codon:yes stop_codon:yes gene_type:complete